MNYYISREIKSDFDKAVKQVKEGLVKENFDILCDIDMSNEIRKKLNTDYPGYRIIGACNAETAHTAIELEKQIGTLLIFNVIVREKENDYVEIAAVDPEVSLRVVNNLKLDKMVKKIRGGLARVITHLQL